MATIHCPDGHIFPDIADPNPDKMYLIRDDQSEEMAEKIIETCKSGGDIEVIVHYLVMATGSDVYQCPVCGRLLIFDNQAKEVRSYVHETTRPLGET